MGLRGPPPTPTPILKARGSKLVSERTGEVQFEQGRPTIPAWLIGEARAEWNRQVKQLDDAGVLQKPDRTLLAAWCEAWGEFCSVNERIQEVLSQPPPAAPTDASGNAAPRPYGWELVIASGLLNAKNKAVERLLRLSREFGFSPSARARIRAPEGEEQSSSGKARFFA